MGTFKNKMSIDDINKRISNTKIKAICEADPAYDSYGWKIRRCICLCECGKNITLHVGQLVCGRHYSCGCSNRNIKYSQNIEEIYGCWRDMNNRCYNEKVKGYINYGAVGVKVCEEWRYDYESFLQWALKNGWKKGLQLDKDILGNGKLYSPLTCKFVTSKENSANKRCSVFVLYNGEKVNRKVLCNSKGFDDRMYNMICNRMDSGWSAQDAIDIPKKNKRKKAK